MKVFRRGVGLLILAVALVAALLLWWAVSASAPAGRPPERGVAFGLGEVLYDLHWPPLGFLLASVTLALVFALGVSFVEKRIATGARRSNAPDRLPLAPRVVMAQTRGHFAGPVTINVLIPAHNEAERIGATLESLRAQSRGPDRIIVVADNCTDETVAIAQAAGVEVFETVGNVHKKAGGLNQALKALLPTLGDNDTVMVMDADTVLDQGFLAEADRRMTDDRALMSIGGLFYGEDGAGVIGQYQRNEYTRYARDLRRRRGMVFVLTGTASIFRARALRTVAEQRGSLLPGIPGDVYDTLALTEDNELTIALKSLGALIISPNECTVVTEVMPTWRQLWVQRLRWQRGALENIGAYGLRWQTWRYWVQQLGICYGVIALLGYLGMLGITVLALDEWVWFPFWLGIGLVFMVERVWTVRKGGWRAVLLAALVIPELLYATFLGLVYLKGIWDITFNRAAAWHAGEPA